MYLLHGFSQSGNTFKVAFMLRALGVPWEAVFVDYMRSGQTRDPQWRESVNEMGEAPVLEADGKRLSQSGAILTWLADRHCRFGGRDADEKYEVLRWLLYDNHKFTSYFATWRFMKSFAPSPPDPAVAAFLKARIETCFGIVDRHLERGPFIVGDEPTIADMSLSGYLFFPPEESGYDVAGQYPQIGAWLARLREIPGWADPYAVLPGERIAPKW
ncbi:MAG TPA: glutathione S-transferase [Ramlibacter sp.]|uniref:glutathione S-transferase family protein n=1 Tax=Ramlibacter sp. TaxID=1917967 RepID=UPI002B9F06E1|nr:glutathione S-transferase [Ramlibacter sp.]HVZ42169.1 glutathione S-transferase [Ramlibacter sp.]